MKISSVFDDEFREYGRVITGYPMDELIESMRSIPLPETGTAYEPDIDVLKKCGVFPLFSRNLFGGQEIELGMCWGSNTKLNCLEYHRDSEFNVGSNDFILLLAKRCDIRDGKLDTKMVVAFFVPRRTLIEVFATTLHYAPCDAKSGGHFRVAVVLPKGTNTPKEDIIEIDDEDRLLFARNKWLLAHEDAPEAAQGAYIGLTGKNIDISEFI
ncbi:MAG: DUF4867 family protein [Clostridia bacterium]|nr:DUF4867 family protein [Clostridia bacterium]